MKNSFFIDAVIKLNESALKWVAVWPMSSKFRTSFWISERDKTCPCELQNNGEIKHINEEYRVVLMLPKIDFLVDKLIPGSKFYFGLSSEPMGEGKIIDLINDYKA